MNLYEFYASDKKVNITENLIHAKDVEIDVITENLRKWFKEKWVRFGPDGKIRGDCARGSESEGKPKCLPRSKAQSLGKKGRASAASKKRREDPNPERRGSAINVSTKVKEEHELTLKNVFENKGRATGVDTTAKAQRDRLSTASVGAGPGPGARSQTPPAGVQRQSPVQLVDPASAARYANRLSTTKIITSPGVSKATPTVSSTMNQQAKLGIIDQGLSRLAGNLVKRDGKWFHPGGVPVTNPELIKKAEMSISRPPGTTASGTVKPAPTTGVSTDTSSTLSGGGADDERSSSSAVRSTQSLSQTQRDAEDQTLSRLSISEPVTKTQSSTSDTSAKNAITIQWGDTLSAIAKENGTTVAELMRLNPKIVDPNKIFAGAKLNIPTFTSSTSEPEIKPKPALQPTASSVQSARVNSPIKDVVTPPSATQGTTFPSPPGTAQNQNQQQELRANLTPEQLKYAEKADLSRPEMGSTGVIERMPLPGIEEISAAIGNAEAKGNPDIAYGDRVKDGNIVSTVKANRGSDKGKPLFTAEQWSEQNLGGAKKLSDMTVDEVMRFQKYRSDNHSNANAVGAYQFVGNTLANVVKNTGIDPKTTKFDLATQNKLLQELTKENARVLKRNGIVPDKVNLYMAHAVGGRGALDIYDNLRQNPNKTVIDSLMDGWKSRSKNKGKDPEAQRRRLLVGNPHFRDMRVGEYYNYLSGAIRGDRRNTDYYRRTKTSQVREEACPHCSGPMFNVDMLTEKKDACYYKVKSRYKVWPSAYASGALVKCRKRGASNWGKSKTNENLYFNVVGTDKKILINEFNMRRDVRGWYLTGDSASSEKLDAFRAFGIPLTEEELNQAGYSGSAATIGVDNPISPVGSLSKSQRINKKSRSK
jgi:LysM repeat protein